MQSAPVLVRAVSAGLVTGLLATGVAVWPALAAGAADTRLFEYGALLVMLLGMVVGLRVATRLVPTVSVEARLVAVLLIAGLGATLLGAALFRLYTEWRPLLLAARFEALVAATAHATRPAEAYADLVAHRRQYLDPMYQAVSGAGTPFFFAMLLGGYVAFRGHVVRRLGGPRR
jgi:hypothetical protein